MELWFSEAYSLGPGCGTPELLTRFFLYDTVGQELSGRSLETWG